MDIEPDQKCRFDYLLVNGQKYCGTYPPPPLFSMGSELKVVMVSDASKPSKGFSAHSEAIEIGCGGSFKQGQPAMAISPEHIKENPFIERCFWEIQANQSYIVVLQFAHIQRDAALGFRPRITYSNVPCSKRSSFIMVNDTDGTLIKRFCSDQLPPSISSTGSKLFITYVLRSPLPTTEPPTITTTTTRPSTGSLTNTSFFEMQQITPPTPLNIEQFLRELSRARETPELSLLPSVEERSFYANYFFIKAKNYCSKNLFSNSGVIRSPRFPRRYTGECLHFFVNLLHSHTFLLLAGLNCTYILHVDNGQQIKLNVTAFELEPRGRENGVCYDKLEVRNGRRADSPLIGKRFII